METELEAMMVGGWVKEDRAKLFLRVSLKCNASRLDILCHHAENFKRPQSAVVITSGLWHRGPRAREVAKGLF